MNWDCDACNASNTDDEITCTHCGAIPTVREETQSDRIERKLDGVLEKMSKVEVMTAEVIEQVKPTIDELMNSQLFKMLGMKKAK